MEVDCEGCAGCCVDWRALASGLADDRGADGREPIDDATNLVPLERDEVRAFVSDGFGDALTPRLWRVVDPDVLKGDQQDGEQSPPAPSTVRIDGEPLAAVAGRPVFYVGLRQPPKPVAPFDTDPTWLPTCAFLDPETLQCRIHGGDNYPNACAAYPSYNLLLDQETECERVERAHGGQRLVDDTPPEDPPGLELGPHALGAKLFAHPDPDDLDGRIRRLADGTPTDEDRATFVAAAAASSPGTLSVDRDRYDRIRAQVLDADSWVGRAIDDWTDRSDGVGTPAPDPAIGARVEDDRGAPPTPGWE